MTKQFCVKRFDASQEYYFKEGCYITEVSNSDADGALSIAQARVQPKTTTRWHMLTDTTERYVILEGCGLVEVGTLAAQRVSKGDVVIIPAGTRQRISNLGTDDLKFLALCSPRFKTENYVAIAE